MLDASENIILDRASAFPLYIRDPDGDAMTIGLELEVVGLFKLTPIADTVTAGRAVFLFTPEHALMLGNRQFTYFLRETIPTPFKHVEGKIWATGSPAVTL